MSAIDKNIQEAIELITLPGVYLKLKRLIDDEDSVIDDFAKAIHLDPKLSVTVLKLVNSAFFGFTGQVESLNRAVNMIGIGQVHNLALGVSAVSALKIENDFISLKDFWRTGLFTGVLSRHLAQRIDLPKNDRLFIIGLLHEIGHLVMYGKFADLTKKVIKLMEAQSLKDFSAEQKVFGSHYGDVGAKLMDKWDLSPSFANITRCQPTPQLAEEDKIETALIHLSRAYARQLFVTPDIPPEETINPVVWSITGLTPEQVEDSLDESRAMSAEMEVFILK